MKPPPQPGASRHPAATTGALIATGTPVFSMTQYEELQTTHPCSLKQPVKESPCPTSEADRVRAQCRVKSEQRPPSMHRAKEASDGSSSGTSGKIDRGAGRQLCSEKHSKTKPVSVTNSTGPEENSDAPSSTTKRDSPQAVNRSLRAVRKSMSANTGTEAHKEGPYPEERFSGSVVSKAAKQTASTIRESGSDFTRPLESMPTSKEAFCIQDRKRRGTYTDGEVVSFENGKRGDTSHSNSVLTAASGARSSLTHPSSTTREPGATDLASPTVSAAESGTQRNATFTSTTGPGSNRRMYPSTMISQATLALESEETVAATKEIASALPSKRAGAGCNPLADTETILESHFLAQQDSSTRRDNATSTAPRNGKAHSKASSPLERGDGGTDSADASGCLRQPVLSAREGAGHPKSAAVPSPVEKQELERESDPGATKQGRQSSSSAEVSCSDGPTEDYNGQTNCVVRAAQLGDFAEVLSRPSRRAWSSSTAGEATPKILFFGSHSTGTSTTAGPTARRQGPGFGPSTPGMTKAGGRKNKDALLSSRSTKASSKDAKPGTDTPAVAGSDSGRQVDDIEEESASREPGQSQAGQRDCSDRERDGERPFVPVALNNTEQDLQQRRRETNSGEGENSSKKSECGLALYGQASAQEVVSSRSTGSHQATCSDQNGVNPVPCPAVSPRKKGSTAAGSTAMQLPDERDRSAPHLGHSSRRPNDLRGELAQTAGQGSCQLRESGVRTGSAADSHAACGSRQKPGRRGCLSSSRTAARQGDYAAAPSPLIIRTDDNCQGTLNASIHLSTHSGAFSSEHKATATSSLSPRILYQRDSDVGEEVPVIALSAGVSNSRVETSQEKARTTAGPGSNPGPANSSVQAVEVTSLPESVTGLVGKAAALSEIHSCAPSPALPSVGSGVMPRRSRVSQPEVGLPVERMTGTCRRSSKQSKACHPTDSLQCTAHQGRLPTPALDLPATKSPMNRDKIKMIATTKLQTSVQKDSEEHAKEDKKSNADTTVFDSATEGFTLTACSDFGHSQSPNGPESSACHTGACVESHTLARRPENHQLDISEGARGGVEVPPLPAALQRLSFLCTGHRENSELRALTTIQQCVMKYIAEHAFKESAFAKLRVERQLRNTTFTKEDLRRAEGYLVRRLPLTISIDILNVAPHLLADNYYRYVGSRGSPQILFPLWNSTVRLVDCIANFLGPGLRATPALG